MYLAANDAFFESKHVKDINNRYKCENGKYNNIVKLGRKPFGIPRYHYPIDKTIHNKVYIPAKFWPLFSIHAKQKAFHKKAIASHLRSYQVDAVRAWMMHEDGNGIIVVPCGGGKTTIGISIAEMMNVVTVVACPTRDIVKQWQERIGKNENIHVTTYKSLSKTMAIANPKMLIVDECHHMASSTLKEACESTGSIEYFLGLTATPYREDGEHPILNWYLGDTVYKISFDELVNQKHIMRPTFRLKQTMFDYRYEGDHSAMLSALERDADRNRRIIAELRELVKQFRKVLAIVRTIEHGEEIANMLKSDEIRMEFVQGSMNKKKRAEIVEKAAKGNIDIMIATQLADEGLDCPAMDTLVLCSPTKAHGRVVQRIGRVCRPYPDKKQPLIVDFVDMCGPLKTQYYKRLKVYKEFKGI